ncbi:hypothetical protein FA15DRAFT_641108 [Coprinopsis marcescibilis]|uniref:F-box domain-containing protein n=1 Tax=Coprinopsis marcescibilis TaxID=230819 RepID=A0A5C3KV25_COPMA|nr:hypothetical protein FA15DRAFT_641108 [Coprinopsis marcescibilis]
MPAGTLSLSHLNGDVLSEILGYLDVEDVINVRKASRALMVAGAERAVWHSVYTHSRLLLPLGPLSHQHARDLERLLVRSTLLYRTWGPNPSRAPRTPSKYTFPRKLPTYGFDAQMISGRYLQIAEECRISWYDLDGDRHTPLVSYECPCAIDMVPGYLSHQTNAQDQGESSIWVTFICSYPTRVMVLKLCLDGTQSTVTLQVVIPGERIIEVKLSRDYILLVKEFVSRDEPTELYHIPSNSIFYVPRHSQIQKVSDLSHMNYTFSPSHLLTIYPLRTETHIEAYPLPHTPNGHLVQAIEDPHLKLSHRGVYPQMLSRINLFNQRTHRTPQTAEATGGVEYDLSLLTIAYMPHPVRWTAEINLQLLDARLSHSGMIEFSTRCSYPLKLAGIAVSSLSSTSNNGVGFAVTQSSAFPPDLNVYHIQHQHGTEPSAISVQSLKIPAGLENRELLGFDGYRGRLCLIDSWTRIEILDYMGM